MIRRLLAAIFLCAALPAAAQDCRYLDHDGNTFAICEIDMNSADLRLFLNDESGTPFGQFTAVDASLAKEGGKLAFAMNAGMYHEDRSPVGYYVENGVELMRIVPNAGPGNFGLLPNGVFCIREDRADVFETLAFIEANPACTYATQSGPMLVIDGKLHPRFLLDSTSRYVRNGVGTSADGSLAVFAISRNPVTFHEFGRLFRDALGLPNALYFDGNVSRLYAPDLDRQDGGFPLGPIIGLVVPEH